jgi:hypothetical protein
MARYSTEKIGADRGKQRVKRAGLSQASGAVDHQHLEGRQRDITSLNPSTVNLDPPTPTHRIALTMNSLERELRVATGKNNLPGVMLAATNYDGMSMSSPFTQSESPLCRDLSIRLSHA